MKKKTLFSTICFTIFALLALLGYKTYRVRKIRSETEQNIEKLPALSAFFPDSILSRSSFSPVIVYHFSPDCEHCQFMAKEINGNIGKLDDTNILMITEASKKDALQFMTDYGLDNIQGVHLGIDSTYIFFKTFGSFAIPSFYVYNNKHVLTRAVKGETKIENLINSTKAIGKN